MDNLFDKQYLDTTLILLKSQLADLWQWSAYNEDLYIEEIDAIKNAIEKLEFEMHEREEATIATERTNDDL